MRGIPIARFERSMTRVVVAAHGVIKQSVTCQGEFSRIDDGRSVRCFSGAPPRGIDRLPPASIEGDEEIATGVASVDAPMTFTRRDAVRTTVIDGARGPDRVISSWSAMAQAARRWIGWSGAGNGLAEMPRIAEEIRSMNVALSRARPMDAGVTAAVVSTQVASVLLHETIGHVIEGDATPVSIVGRRIAAACVTVHDDPTANEAPGSYQYDDENTRALGSTMVVREGVVVAQVHSVATATQAGTLSTANGRAASIWHEPIPRVSNLLCTAGSDPVDALVDRCREGIYIHRVANGIKNGAQIQADIVLAERIARGRRTGEMLTGGRIDDSACVPLRIVEVGAGSCFSGNAMCGKHGQLLFNVGTSAPPLRLTSVAIYV